MVHEQPFVRRQTQMRPQQGCVLVGLDQPPLTVEAREGEGEGLEKTPGVVEEGLTELRVSVGLLDSVQEPAMQVVGTHEERSLLHGLWPRRSA